MTRKYTTSGMIRRFLSVLLCLCMLMSFMPFAALAVDAGAGDGGTAPTGRHIAGLAKPLVSGFANWSTAENVTISEDSSSATFINAGKKIIAPQASENQIISDKKFLISLDLTSNTENAGDFLVIFKADGTTTTSNRLQVRFNFANKKMVIERTSNDTVQDQDWGGQNTAATVKDFTWTAGNTYGVDILVDSEKNTVTVYLDGNEETAWTVNNVPFNDVTSGYFAIGGFFPNQNFTIANLKITTDETETPPVTQEQVATPVISDADANGKVTISCDTSDAKIYYTTNGDTPTTNSTLYTDAGVILIETKTVKAIAVKDGMTDSEVATKEITISSGGGEEPSTGNHIPALNNTAISGFSGGTGWTNGAEGNFSLAEDGSLKAESATGATIIKYQYDKTINADNFLIQFDWTLHNATPNVQFRTRFKIDGSGNYVQVRFHTTSGGAGGEHTEMVCIGGFNGSDTVQWGDAKNGEFKLKTGETAKIDIKVEGDTITVYKDGTEVVAYTNPDQKISGADRGAFAFASNWQNQYTVSNLLITTNEDLNAEPTKVSAPVINAVDGTVTLTCATKGAEIYYTTDGTTPGKSSTKYSSPFTLTETATVKAIAVKEGLTDSAVAEKEIVVANKDVVHKLEPLSRVLLPTSALDNAASWDITSGSTGITIGNGEAHLVTGGANHRMGYNVAKINANKFLIRLDYTPNAGATNTNTKIAFKCTDQYEGDRLQVRLNPVQGQVTIERGTAGDADAQGVWGGKWCERKNFTWTRGLTYGIDILVEGNKITVYINGEEIISKTHDDISAMAMGYFAISTQFPTGDVTIKNLSITTDEQQTGEQYTVTLKTYTDGVESASGGTLTADTLTGYAGDLITLTPSPAHGYVLEKYTSYKADGSSTDGLMPINNNMFTLDAKFGNVTVIAHFVKRTPGKFELFYDDFAAAELDSSYQVKAADKITQDGVVTMDATDTNYMILDQAIFAPVKEREGLRISVDAWKGNSTDGTMQIMFKGTSFDDRYVLVINGNAAFLKHISSSENKELTRANFTFNSTKANLVLEVQGDTAVFLANGKEVLRYTSPDNWGGAANGAGLINMTPNAPVCFDNLLVERIPEQINVVVKNYILSGGAESEDSTSTAGIASSNASKAVAGDVVTLTAVAKPGYELLRYTVTDGAGKSIAVTDSAFTVPDDAANPITVKAVFQPAGVRVARAFFIDSQGGNDSGDGTQQSPWKSLDKLASYTQTSPLVPGDQVFLKRGSVFDGQQLRFGGMGSETAPVTVSAYGEGDLPRLNGGGEVENVVSLFNQEYITLSQLEITNTDPAFKSDFTQNGSNNSKKALRAINVSAKDFGVVSGITIRDCYIHDVNGNINLKWNGGIFFDVQVTVDPATPTLVGVPTKYDNVLIENCTFINVDRSGIKLVSSGWCNQWLGNDKTKPINWYPSTNVVVRNNYMEKIGGDGITTRDTDGALVEYNLVKDCRYQNTGYNVGIWPFQAANTVIQYNEAYNTHSTTDGQGLDCDHASAYSLMQYNYSHNNEGGFMLIMGGYPHTAPTVRYNISQNDRDKTFEFAQGLPMGTMIYNNTFYSGTPVSRGIFFLSNTAIGRGINDFYAFNNLFIYPQGQTIYGNMVTELKAHAKLYNNGYVGLTAPAEEEKAITASDAAEVLVNAGSGPETNATKVPVNGKSDALAGYQLKAGSPMIDQGITLAQAIEHFGGAGFQVFDGRSLSPNALETQYYGKGESSLKYVMGENFPRVSGVDYTLDFFGNPNLQGEHPDIGAAEALDHEHTGGKATCAAGAECTICHKHYGPLDPENHTGNTEVRGAYPATSSQPGYTGDTYCADCGALLEEGSEIPVTGGGNTGGGSTGGGSSTPPVTTDTTVKDPQSQETTTNTTARPAATIQGNTASSTVSTSMGNEIVKQAEQSRSEAVVIVPEINGDVSHTEVSIPAKTVEQLGSKTEASLTVSTPVADVSIPNEALGDLAKTGGNVTVSAERGENTVQVTVSANGKAVDRVPGGITVAVPVEEAKPGTVAVLVHEDGTREVIRKSVAKDGSVSMPLDGSAKIEIVDNSKTFNDVPADNWASDAASFASARELFNGTAPGQFSPNVPVSRGMLAVVLHNLENNPEQAVTGAFSDVDSGKWYAEGVSWAAEKGIITGYGGNKFGPDDGITREQLAVMLWRYARSPAAVSSELDFADTDQVSSWAQEALLWATGKGILNGKGGGILDPTGKATRAEAAQIIKNLLERR